MSLWGMPQRVKNCAKCAVRCVGDAGDIRMLEKHAAISVENANGIDRSFVCSSRCAGVAQAPRYPQSGLITLWITFCVPTLTRLQLVMPKCLAYRGTVNRLTVLPRKAHENRIAFAGLPAFPASR
jgi:hypothetical protein